jgi:hypothetical protein
VYEEGRERSIARCFYVVMYISKEDEGVKVDVDMSSGGYSDNEERYNIPWALLANIMATMVRTADTMPNTMARTSLVETRRMKC